jgi:hypothetical protein
VKHLRLLAASLLLATFLPPEGIGQQEAAADERLFKAFSNGSFKVRLQAAIVIGKKRITSGKPFLRKALEDEHHAVRAAAAISLGKIGDQNARVHIVRLLAEKNKLVYKSAEKSLILLDKILGGPRHFIVITKAQTPSGTDNHIKDLLNRTIRENISKTTDIVFSRGEEKILNKAELAAHMKKRKLMGVLLQPKLSKLSTKSTDNSSITSCKVNILSASLIKERIEFSAEGEADAEVESAEIDDDMRLELEKAVVSASATAASENIVDYLTRRTR